MSERPEDVFTPQAPVRDDMFATRRHEDLQERMQGALAQKGNQVVLYGPTGVGKTSLTRFLCSQGGIKYVRVECGAPFDSMLRAALTEVVTEEVVERVRSMSGEVEAGVLAAMVGIKFKGGGSSDVRTTVIERPLPLVVVEALDVAGVKVLFLDNYENLADQEHAAEAKVGIVQLLKSLSDRAADDNNGLKAVVAGIPEASEELVTTDQATARRLSQIEVGRMPPGELDQILARGEAKLGIIFAGLCREAIVQFSDGFPYYTHLFALHCSRRVITAGRTEVELSDFDAALEAILADCDLQLRSTYDEAVESSGEVRTRKTILQAMANRNDVEIPFRLIREEFLVIRPEYEKASALNFLSTVMPDLRDKYGIIADRSLPKSKNNRYRFSNPLMRAYVRLRRHQDERAQGQLDVDQAAESD